jgi:tRNA(Ile)-lysidine synthase
MLLARVHQVILTHGLITSGDRGLIGFSGGPDSLCLLQLLSELRAPLGFSLLAAHVDHGLRETSAQEAQQARQLAEELGVEAVILTAKVRRTGTGNLQERARLERARLLQEVAEERQCTWIALAHTANDQAETVIMRAVRGAGVRGLGGMARQQERIIRPLLDVTRSEIEQYLRTRPLGPILDPTNDSDRYFRNRVRHHVLPLLEQEQPSVVQTLCRLAETCREEDETLTLQARAYLERGKIEDGLDLRAWRGCSAGLLHRILRLAYHEATGSLRRLERHHVLALARLIRDPAGTAAVDLPGGRFERRYQLLLWQAGGPLRPPWAIRERTISSPGLVPWDAARSLYLGPEGGANPLRCSKDVWLDAERVPFPLIARTLRSGDRIAIGERQHKKVARVLMEAKIPRAEREKVPLLLAGQEVVAIVGLRAAYPFDGRSGGTRFCARLVSTPE